MFENLEVFLNRDEELKQRLCDPAVAADNGQYTACMKELRDITPIVETYRQYKTVLRNTEEAKALLNENGVEKDLRELALQEYDSGREELEKIAGELKLLLLPKDPNDERSVLVEIRAGAGGEEAALFSAVLYRMYTLYAQRHGWTLEVNNVNETELGGLKEITFSVEGESVYSRMKFESGVHRVQRVPETETQGRIHTSTATVAVLPEVDEVEVEIDPKDIQIDVFRSSGAGGQKVNKTSSAIRVTHLPTGMVVECQDERSQYKNKDKAMKVLRSRLYEKMQAEQDSEVSAQRRSQVGTGDRSERIRTYNFPQSRVTDHRIGLTLYRIEEIVAGDLDELIDALIAADRAKALEETMQAE